MHAPVANYTGHLEYRGGRVSEKVVLRSERRKLRTASTTGERRGVPLRGGQEKKGLKVAVVRDMGASAPARVRASRPLPRPQPRPRPVPTPTPTPTPTRPDPVPSRPRIRICCFFFFPFLLKTFFFFYKFFFFFFEITHKLKMTPL